ncbi:MAG: caspase family protein [Pseudomonadota bacterium]
MGMTSMNWLVPFVFLCSASVALSADRAVVVGIDHYRVLEPAKTTASRKDAVKFQQYLQDVAGMSAGSITLLTDEAATADAIIGALNDRLLGETEAGDRAIFYFSGRGVRLPDEEGSDRDGHTEALLAQDAVWPSGILKESDLVRIFDKMRDREVTLVIDAATADPPELLETTVFTKSVRWDRYLPKTRGVKRIPPSVETFSEPPFASGEGLRDVWLAAAPSQTAWATDAGSIFTDLFIEGATNGRADSNDNGVVTNAELLLHVRKKSEEWCKANADCVTAGLGLTPDFSGDVSAFPIQDDTQQKTATFTAEDEDASIVGNSNSSSSGSSEDFENTLAFVTDLLAPSNAAGLEIKVDPSTKLSLNDFVQFEVRSARAGSLILLDVNPNGELFQIFPSVLSVDDTYRIEADTPRILPDVIGNTGRPLRVRVVEPTGKGVLVAILVEGEVPALDDILPENVNGDPVPNANQYLYAITQALLDLQASTDGNTRVEWSAAYLPYEISK